MKTLIIDNYDSFTFNLYQMVAVVNGEPPHVVRNDQASWDEVKQMEYENILVSPGPGHPGRAADFGVSAAAIREADAPLLGVCLGHQGIAHLAGGRVVHAPRPMHGRLSRVEHDGRGLYEGIPQGFAVVRYHSLMVDADALPAEMRATAWADDGVLMGVQHRTRPLWGVQFHPESICTTHGEALLRNFRDLSWARRRSAPRRREGAAVRSVVPTGRAAAARSIYALASRQLDWAEPEEAFVRVYGDSPTAFWLDSSRAEPGGARFSFMGDAAGPLALRVAYDVAARMTTVVERGESRVLAEEVLAVVRRLLAERRVRDDGLPFDFQCGFVGYLGYELKADCGAARAHASAWPDAQLVFADRLVVFDHEERRTYLVALDSPVTRASTERWMDLTEARLAEARAGGSAAPATDGPQDVAFVTSHERDAYVGRIAACQRAIVDGESYELCLTRRIWARTRVDGLRLHRVLRRTNPAPYAAFLRCAGIEVVCSSPELFLRIDRERRVESKPIKGTRPRGRTPAEDAALAVELAAAEKDRAENLMIVDLLRNDLGVVCEVGSVHVPAMMRVETYATVHQLVSTVAGTLRADVDALDCVQHAFPGGSMTGAPKLRSMQILDELEGEARGVYSGAIGYLSCSGAIDLNIVIRTIVVEPEAVTLGVGGAIIAPSDPDDEFVETQVKARVLLQAIALVAEAPARKAAG